MVAFKFISILGNLQLHFASRIAC